MDWGMLCSPHHHRAAALSIFTETHRDGTCVLPVGESWAQTPPILSFPCEHCCSQFSSKGGEKEPPANSNQAHLISRHWETQKTKHKDILFSICIASTGVWNLHTSFERVTGTKKRPNLRLFYSSVVKPWKDNICLSAVILKSVYL